MANNRSWDKIFKDYKILEHNFDKSPFLITASQIKKACQDFTETSEKEVRVLCKQDTREQRPQIFQDNDLFILPVKNGDYYLIKGEGYIDVPEISSEPVLYDPKIEFDLDTVKIGDSEMQHLDYAYAISIIRTFVNDPTLVLTIRGRKYTPRFSFRVGENMIETTSVQTEVDAGYEGIDKVVLVEAKNGKSKNTIIRQLYYPYRQWQEHTKKEVMTVFFEREKNGIYNLWLFEFEDVNDYNSIRLKYSARYKVE